MELVFIRMGYPCRIYGLDFPPLRGSTVVLLCRGETLHPPFIP